MTGEELLKLGQDAREAGRTFEALDLLNRSLEVFAREKDLARFAHVLLDRGICWQHLYQFNHNDPGFAVLYKKDAEAMLEILLSQHLNEELDGAYYMNAKAASLYGDYAKAVELFRLAIQHLPQTRLAQKGDWRTSLGKALYYSGEKDKGVQEALEGVEQIKAHAAEIDVYMAGVWVSGGYMKLAEMFLQDEPAKSAGYVEQAKAVLGNDSQFAVRRKQLDNFIETGKSGL